VYKITGQPISHQQLQFEEGKPADQCRVFVMGWPRMTLHHRIDQRVQWMFEAGLVDEVQGLLDRFGRLGRTASQAVGYREVIAHLQNHESLDATIQKVKARTHQFARRQETWFRSLSECRRIEQSTTTPPAEVAQQLVQLGSKS
jgi:tRNA dimethylallyltransferase